MLFEELKKFLLEDSQHIVDLLSVFGFEKIQVKQQEIRFARSSEAGLNISIRINNNEYLNVSDYVRSEHCDIFSYICKEKNVQLREVLQETRRVLGLSDNWKPQKQRQLFGGIYASIGKNTKTELKTYNESVLSEYQPYGNIRWLKDGISLEAQKFYDVSFDIETNRIVFPWRSVTGEIISLKARLNEDDVPDDVPKYLYFIRNNISMSLFNYSNCYQYLYGNDVYVFESEKSCMKLWGWGIKNTVAIGSHSLSSEQCKLLMQLQPRTIYLMLDSDLDLSETKKNADLIKNYARLRDVKIKFWNWTYNLDLDSKSAPCDGSREEWNYILENEIESIGALMEEGR